MISKVRETELVLFYQTLWLGHLSNQSDAKLKPIQTRSGAFSTFTAVYIFARQPDPEAAQESLAAKTRKSQVN